METAFWEGVLGVEGEMTGDGRLIEKGALRWDDTLPAPMRIVIEDVGAHDGATVAGRILSIERRPGGIIWGSGDFDLGSTHGVEALRVVDGGIQNGVSMDLDDVSFEIRVAAELMEQMDSMIAVSEGEEEEVKAEQKVDDEGRITVMEMSPDDEVMVTTDGRIRAATIVAIPAFARARIEVTEKPDDGSEDSMDEELAAIVASGSRKQRPPAEWFSNPNLTGVTPLTVTPDGRVYGHLAAWGTCHISHTAQGECTQPPNSLANYGYFHVSMIEAADGREIAVGKLTVNTKHAGQRLTPVSTLAHYEDTGATAAYVRAGEDAHGIWVAGSVAPDATEKQIRALRSSPLSGDWRRINGNLELVAALSVNVPGFPVPRPSGMVAGGAVVSLVASGMVPPKKVAPPGSPDALSVEDLRYLKQLARRERQESLRARAAELAARVRPNAAGAVADRAHALATRVRATTTGGQG